MTKEPKQLQELARMIAEHLEGWEYRPVKFNDKIACISIPESNEKTPGATIVMSFDWKEKTKLHIGGEYPRHRGHEYPSLSYRERRICIGVNANKSPKQIAKDISRRLLPQYLSEFAEGLEIVRTHTENDKKAIQQALELQALIPGSEIFDKDYRKCLRIYTDTYSGEIEPYYSSEKTTIDMNLRRLPLSTAKDVLRALTAS